VSKKDRHYEIKRTAQISALGRPGTPGLHPSVKALGGNHWQCDTPMTLVLNAITSSSTKRKAGNGLLGVSALQRCEERPVTSEQKSSASLVISLSFSRTRTI
jgi:hypothetical protein